MSWYLLGSGSLGCLWAARLAGAGLPLRLLLRNEQRLADYRRSGGLCLRQQDQRSHVRPPAEQVGAPGAPIQRLILACKAYDAAAAAQQLATRVAAGAHVLLLQNGLGSQQAVADALPQAHCLAVSSTEGAYRDADFSCVLAGHGNNWIGSLDGSPAPPWLEQLDQAAIPWQWSEQITGALWRKLAINCAINPLTVLHRCRNGQLHAHAAEVNAILEELQALLRAVDQPAAAEGLQAQVWHVIEATAANYSSMYQDVARGQPTELEFILGHACREATRRGVPLPALDALYRSLRAQRPL